MTNKQNELKNELNMYVVSLNVSYAKIFKMQIRTALEAANVVMSVINKTKWHMNDVTMFRSKSRAIHNSDNANVYSILADRLKAGCYEATESFNDGLEKSFKIQIPHKEYMSGMVYEDRKHTKESKTY